MYFAPFGLVVAKLIVFDRPMAERSRRHRGRGRGRKRCNDLTKLTIYNNNQNFSNGNTLIQPGQNTPASTLTYSSCLTDTRVRQTNSRVLQPYSRVSETLEYGLTISGLDTSLNPRRRTWSALSMLKQSKAAMILRVTALDCRHGTITTDEQ